MDKLEKQKTKEKVVKLVKQYIDLFPEEYKAFQKMVRVKVEVQKNEFASTEMEGVLERLLFEMPETLLALFQVKLTPDEQTWFDSKEGARWFVTAFPVFKVANKV